MRSARPLYLRSMDGSSSTGHVQQRDFESYRRYRGLHRGVRISKRLAGWLGSTSLIHLNSPQSPLTPAQCMHSAAPAPSSAWNGLTLRCYEPTNADGTVQSTARLCTSALHPLQQVLAISAAAPVSFPGSRTPVAVNFSASSPTYRLEFSGRTPCPTHHSASTASRTPTPSISTLYVARLAKPTNCKKYGKNSQHKILLPCLVASRLRSPSAARWPSRAETTRHVRRRLRPRAVRGAEGAGQRPDRVRQAARLLALAAR